MLILTRRVGESIVVGDDIVLTVFEVRGDAVRVGIEAPRSVQVHRQEVYDELKRQNEQAVSPSEAAVNALAGALDPHSVPAPGETPDAAEPTKLSAAAEPTKLSAAAEPTALPAAAEPTKLSAAAEGGPPRLVRDQPNARSRSAKPGGSRSRSDKPGPPPSS